MKNNVTHEQKHKTVKVTNLETGRSYYRKMKQTPTTIACRDEEERNEIQCILNMAKYKYCKENKLKTIAVRDMLVAVLKERFGIK